MAEQADGAAVGTGPTPEGEDGEVAMTAETAGEEMAMLREALLAAYPEAVPELVGGESVGAMLASLGPARAAWERVAEAVGARSAAAPAAPPPVPAGSAPPVAVDVAALPPTEKIRRGLAARR